MAHLGPFEVNPHTQEPFLRLRKHSKIIITPPRESDVTDVIPHLNDERVHIWCDTPFPYTLEHARNWITKIKAQCDLGLKELIDALEDPTSAQESVALTHVPVCFLREIQEDGSELLLGHMGIFRCPHITLLDNPKYDSEINSSLPTGHTDIVWTIGDWLVPSYHRKGIMTDAIDTLISDLAKPFLGATHFTAMIYGGNEGSNKVFLRNGFTFLRCVTKYRVIKGVMRDLYIFERHDGTK